MEAAKEKEEKPEPRADRFAFNLSPWPPRGSPQPVMLVTDPSTLRPPAGTILLMDGSLFLDEPSRPIVFD